MEFMTEGEEKAQTITEGEEAAVKQSTKLLDLLGSIRMVEYGYKRVCDRRAISSFGTSLSKLQRNIPIFIFAASFGPAY
jgi:hypothetical protein